MVQLNIPDIPRIKTVLVNDGDILTEEAYLAMCSSDVRKGASRGLHNPHTTVTSLHSVTSLGGKSLNVTSYGNRNGRGTFTFCQSCLENDLDTVTLEFKKNKSVRFFTLLYYAG